MAIDGVLNYFGVPYNGNKKLSKLVSNINKNKTLLTPY
jgi:hypothetical protein